MVDLMIGKMNITKILEGKYKALGSGWVTLIQVPAEKHLEVNAESLRILINELKYDCIYITLGKTAVELEELYKKKGVDNSRLYFIDAISRMYGTSEASSNKISYVSGPLDIDAITSSLHTMIQSLKSKNKCVFLDSVTTILLYNSLPRTLRFSQFLTKTLKDMGVSGVMVSIAKGITTAKLTKELTLLCDEVIDIK